MRLSAKEYLNLHRLGSWPLIGLYLAAIVLANLTVALAPPLWRPAVVIANALLLVALDLTTRDALHDAWRGRGLLWRMAALILAGSLLSFLLAGEAGPAALASCAAFGAAAVCDAAIYHRLRGRAWLVRANGSNVVSALVDSAVFLCGLAAFGLLPWRSVALLVLAQWLAKTAGGALWALVLRR